MGFSLDQRHIFSITEYPQFGMRFDIFIITLILLFMGTQLFKPNKEHLTIDKFIRSSIKITILIFLFWIAASLYSWPRLGMNPIQFIKETYVVFPALAISMLFLNALKLLKLRDNIANAGFIIVLSLIVSSAFDAVATINKCLNGNPERTQPVYIGEGIEPDWCHVVSTQEFEIFYDSDKNAAIALPADALKRIDFPRAVNPRYEELHNEGTKSP
ncbi:hypothetical protein NBH19_25375 [Rhizobium sp. S95]|uniref:Uncharacterized protein n=1 Tax=Ciceribacter sichuanensis TaxID=2949647 RepID=A0AAJ1C0X4_9HYPH|nr:hypothetical protein [Ciceribacter sp. S95]MCM2399422.1 hypothetical protein [Ciceribacter sp. S95]MCO5959786.1 hypothetical protein [Ciceribacter sp. S101]